MPGWQLASATRLSVIVMFGTKHGKLSKAVASRPSAVLFSINHAVGREKTKGATTVGGVMSRDAFLSRQLSVDGAHEPSSQEDLQVELQQSPPS
jgi:hypothetical protein